MQKECLTNDWNGLLEAEFNQPYYKKLSEFLTKEYQRETVFPRQEDLFNALNYTAYADVKAVILGQDPYHGPNQAHGLSFSVQPGTKLPPSLRNIYKERSEEHTSELQSRGHLVCRLLL